MSTFTQLIYENDVAFCGRLLCFVWITNRMQLGIMYMNVECRTVERNCQHSLCQETNERNFSYFLKMAPQISNKICPDFELITVAFNHWNTNFADSIKFQLRTNLKYISHVTEIHRTIQSQWFQISIDSGQQFIGSGANNDIFHFNAISVYVHWTKSSTSALLFTFLTICFPKRKAKSE